ncbi:Os01g0781600, partial [Oryza sativa Japonica Group]
LEQFILQFLQIVTWYQTLVPKTLATKSDHHRRTGGGEPPASHHHRPPSSLNVFVSKQQACSSSSSPCSCSPVAAAASCGAAPVPTSPPTQPRRRGVHPRCSSRGSFLPPFESRRCGLVNLHQGIKQHQFLAHFLSVSISKPSSSLICSSNNNNSRSPPSRCSS